MATMFPRHASQFTIEELINALEGAQRTDGLKPDAGIFFDFADLIPMPNGFHSYRGYYEDLQIDTQTDDWERKVTVSSFLAELREQVGATYTGWKGGEFTMGKDTVLWVGQSGDATGTMVVGIGYSEWRCYILTQVNQEDEYIEHVRTKGYKLI